MFGTKRRTSFALYLFSRRSKRKNATRQRLRNMLVEQLESRSLLASVVGPSFQDLPNDIFNSQSTTVSIQAFEGTAQPHFVQGSVGTSPPQLTPEQLALQSEHESLQGLIDFPFPINPSEEGSGISNAAPTNPSLPNNGPSIEAAGDFTFYQAAIDRPAGGSFSTVNEPSLGTMGNTVFTTGNWFASVSGDNGNNFGYVNPYTTFPATWGGFCCDQRAAQDPDTDSVYWYLQYSKDGSSSTSVGGARIAVATTETQLLTNAWTYYDFTPQSFGLAAGKWLDFPHMTVSENYVYATTNVFSTVSNAFTDAVAWRIPISEINAGGSINYQYFTRTTSFALDPIENASTTMYFGSLETSTSMKVFRWTDANALTETTVSGLSTTNFGTHTALDQLGQNWTGRSDSRIQTGWYSPARNEVGFMWNSAQGSGRPLPFVRSVILDPSTLAVSSQPDIWNTTDTYHYPAVAVNARGDVAGVVAQAPLNGAPNATAIIRDDISGGAWQAIIGVTGGQGDNNRWGDYMGAVIDDDYSNTWGGMSYVRETGGNVNPYFLWFGRERDTPLADDHGNTRFSATSAATPSTVAGNLEVAGDNDFFSFSAVQGANYSFSTALGTLADTVLYLYNTDGVTLITSDDDGGPGNASLISNWIAPSTATYYLDVRDFGDNSPGTYTISVIVNDDHANDAASSTPIGLGTTSGVIEIQSDVDYFSFSAVGGARYQFQTNLFGLSDSTLTVYDQDGTTQLAFDDDSGPGNASFIDWIAPALGQYYVKVDNFSSQVGTYTLDLIVVDDHGDTAGAATPYVGSSMGGVIELSTDLDYFSFSAVSGVTYTFRTVLGGLSDSVLYLYSTDGTTLLASDDDGGGGRASLIDWFAPSTGVYFIAVDNFSTQVGSYSLNLSTDDFGDSAATAALVAVPSTTSGNLEAVGDNDFFKFNAVAGGRYIVSTILGTITDTTLALYGTDGTTQLAFNNDNPAGGLASLIDWTAPAAGTYFLDVRDNGDNDTGTYSIQILATPVITSFGGMLTYVENAAPTAISPTATIRDADSTVFAGGILTVQFPVGGTADDRLSIINSGSISTNGAGEVLFGTVVFATYSGGNGTTPLSIVLRANATVGRVQLLLRNIGYSNVSDIPTLDRTVSVQITDGSGGVSIPVTKLVRIPPVNDNPTIAAFGPAITYIENDSAVLVSPAATVVDVDNPNLNGGALTVRISADATPNDLLAILPGGSITLNASNQVLFAGSVMGSFSGGVGATPLVINLNSFATPSRVRVLLRTIGYSNISENPTPVRTVLAQLTDGSGGTSTSVTKLINVTPVNDTPVISSFGSNITFTENSVGVAITSTAVVTDVDSTDFDTGELRVRLTVNAKPEDQLYIRNFGDISTNAANEVLYTGVVMGTYIGGTGVAPLVITFNNTATSKKVQALLRRIQYTNSSENPSEAPRTVSCSVKDGDGGTSIALTKTINVVAVNDAPILGGISGSVAYVRGNRAIPISTTATVSDVDSPNFDTGKLTVRFTSGSETTNRLELSGTLFTLDAANNLLRSGVIIGKLNTGGGVGFTKFEVTFNSTATAGMIQQLLRAITFRTQGASSTTTRTLSVSLTDGDGGTSNTVTKTFLIS